MTETLKLKPYLVETPDVEPIPNLITQFMSGEFGPSIGRSESMEACGFTFEIIHHSNDTGHGMDYLNEFRITQDDKTVYCSGCLKWRNGLPGSTDQPGNRFDKVSVKEVEKQVMVAIRYGNNVIKVHDLSTAGLKTVESYDVGKNDDATQAATRDASTIDGFSGLYRDNDNHPEHQWRQVGNPKFTCDLGAGQILFLNCHSTDVVIGQAHILVVSEGKPYSAVVNLDHQWRQKFQNTTVGRVTVEGNILRFDTSSGNRISTEVELVIDAE